MSVHRGCAGPQNTFRCPPLCTMLKKWGNTHRSLTSPSGMKRGSQICTTFKALTQGPARGSSPCSPCSRANWTTSYIPQTLVQCGRSTLLERAQLLAPDPEVSSIWELTDLEKAPRKMVHFKSKQTNRQTRTSPPPPPLLAHEKTLLGALSTLGLC